jgi:predicted permease
MLRRLRLILHRAWLHREEHDEDLEAELRFHVTQETALLIERGVAPDEARRTARRALGSTALVKETTRGVWRWPALEALGQDVRQGARILVTAPGLSVVAVALVALVIGADTTLFSMVHSVLRKPAAGVHASRLVTVHWTDRRSETEPQTSYGIYLDLAQRVRALRQLIAVEVMPMTLTHDAGSVATRAGLVSAGYLQALGTRVVIGRDLNAGDDAGQETIAAVIGDGLWRSQFGASDGVVGAPLLLNGHPATVVGVAEPGFRGAVLALTSDVWVPLTAFTRIAGEEARLHDRSHASVFVMGQLAPDVTLADARSDLNAAWTALPDLDASQRQLRPELLAYSATADGNSLISRQGDVLMAILTAVMAIVLIVVCANVSNLLVARAVVKQRETALRQSLGAGWLRIVRMLLAEGISIAALASAAAFVAAWIVSRAVSGFVTPSTQGEQVVLPDFTPDWAVAGYAVMMAAAAVIAFTVAPVLRTRRLSLLPLLKRGGTGVVDGGSRASSALVVLQLALSVVLLSSALLAYRSLSLIENRDLGFGTADRLLVTVSTASAAADDDANTQLLTQMADRLAGIPSVVDVAVSRRAPLSGWYEATVATARAGAESYRTQRNAVDPQFLDALGVKLLAGRTFSRADVANGPPVAIVSQSLVSRLWPGESPLGRTIYVADNVLRRGALQAGAAPSPRTIVGVMPDAVLGSLRRDDRPSYVLTPLTQDRLSPGEATFTIGAAPGQLEAVAPLLRRSLKELSPLSPIVFMRTMEGQRDAESWPVRFIARLLALFALAALVIAVVGQYAAVAFDMRRRARELGLRVALGASERQLIASGLRHGVRLTAIAAVIGLLLSVATMQLLRNSLYGVTPTDPLTYTSVAVVLVSSSLFACFLPARRAARADPLTTLRED